MEQLAKKRLFIALNLPEQVKNELVGLLEILKKYYPEIKWVDARGLHLTLHFLGYLDQELEEKIKLVMQSLAGKFSAINFKFNNLGAFPNLDSPRVIYLECEQTNGRSVYKLQQLLLENLNKLSLEVDRRSWQPHLTLGRVKYNGGNKFKVNSEILKNIPQLNFNIPTFELMESQLTPDGARYGIVVSYKL